MIFMHDNIQSHNDWLVQLFMRSKIVLIIRQLTISLYLNSENKNSVEYIWVIFDMWITDDSILSNTIESYRIIVSMKGYYCLKIEFALLFKARNIVFENAAMQKYILHAVKYTVSPLMSCSTPLLLDRRQLGGV